jgi:uncharacterized phage protein (TIGR02220 family)
MNKIRTIKQEFFRHEELFESEKVSGLPLRLAFAGLFCCCDDEGKFKWRPSQLKLDILPYDCIDMSLVLDELLNKKFILKKEEEGEIYGIIPTFKKHQLCMIFKPEKIATKTRSNNKRTYDPSIPSHQVLEYLRQKTGTNFRFIDSILVHIIRRLSEPGITVDDCKKVIDYKFAEWGDHPHFSKFLRPATLFIPAHFYEYLAECDKPALKTKSENEKILEMMKSKKHGGLE